MNNDINIPWTQIYNLVLACGNENDVRSFSIKLITQISSLCEFDQSLIYFLDGNGNINGQYLVNIDKQWSNLYIEYYSKFNDVNHGLHKKKLQKNHEKHIINIIDWEREPHSEFISQYIESRGLKYSLGFSLVDLNGASRTVFALDKTTGKNFTKEEYRAVSLSIPLLNNIHKKFFIPSVVGKDIGKKLDKMTNLTNREVEIINLICQGISPNMISKLLYISPSTTNKHISNIYKKLDVSNIQELLVKLFR